MTKIVDGMMAAIEQSQELDIELGARSGGVDLVLSILVRTGTAMDAFAAQQQPADFSLIGKFADQSFTFLAGGRLNLGGAGDALASLMFGGASTDPKLLGQMGDWIKLASGELGMIGHVTASSKIDYQYLLRSAEAGRLAAAFPKMIDAMSQNGMMEGVAKIARTEKPASSYDGLKVNQSELRYDMSKMPNFPGDKKFTLQSAWAVWDDLIAMTTGVHAAERIKQLIDSARHNKGTWQPNTSVLGSIERARAAKESVWVRMDLSAMTPPGGAASKAALPPGLVPTMSFGAAPHTMWLRISVPTPPSTAGSL